MDERFLQEAGTGIFTGNELIVKGGLESAVASITGYPGSPVAEVFDTVESIRDLLLERGILAQIANNEALSAARLNGSQMSNIRAMAVMKNVGLHVASDALAISNMTGPAPGGGAVCVFGDDTWTEGTQVPADSRFMSQHLYMPVVEPSTFQEIKDWLGLSFELSERTKLYVGFLVTSNQADGGGTVLCASNRYPDVNTRAPVTLDTSQISLDDRVVIPPDTGRKEIEVVEGRFPRLLALVREFGLNRIVHPSRSRKRLGFVTSGLAYCYLEHALAELGLLGAIPILKLGVTHPVDPTIICEFARGVEDLVVVEEKRAFIEPQVTAILSAARQGGELGDYRVWGKAFPEGLRGLPSTRGFNPSILIDHLAPLLLALRDPTVPVDAERLERERALVARTAEVKIRAPGRTPSFCPGCPHRDSASVLKQVTDDLLDPEYMEREHGLEPVDLVFHGDIGCYSMLKYAPFSRLMHNLSGMGLGGGTGAGIDRFITNKQVVFMGDSTFFHSGMTAISDSIKHRQDITYIILDNKTTAMTGHQPTPGIDIDVLGQPTFAQDIEKIVRGLGGEDDVWLARMDPAGRADYRRTVESAMLRDGVKVIVADKECGITFHRRERAKLAKVAAERGYLPEKVEINITPEVCEYCLECTRGTGCTGLTVTETPYGPKIETDLSTCVADTACTKLKACPSFEEVTIRRSAPGRSKKRELTLDDLPEPEIDDFDDVWYCYIAGVGGMGINLVSAVLAKAAAREGLSVHFANKKGLAIRNGSVYSHLNFAKDDRVLSPITPYGKANLLFGLDILEAARGLDPRGTLRVGGPERTAAVVNTAKTPTISTLMDDEDFSPGELEGLLRRYTDASRYFGADIFDIAGTHLGNKLYANIILLGIAWQKGLVPLSEKALHWAIENTVRRRDRETNLKAFRLGRAVAHDPERFSIAAPQLGYADTVESKGGILASRMWGGEKLATAYRLLVAGALDDTALDDTLRADAARRIYDCLQYEGLDYARQYVDLIRETYERDSAEHGFAATRSVIWNLAKCMVIKDEIYVAHLLTSEEKRAHDRARYGVDPENGDRLTYRHFTRPRFTVFGKNIEFDITTRDWQLSLFKHLKFLRRLLPGWHTREKAFRAWYVDLVRGFRYEDEAGYRAYVDALATPEEVRGYREVRYPKMDAARRAAEAALNRTAVAREPEEEPVAA